MKLWLISQTENQNYYVYDSAVVAAESAEAARRVHPGCSNMWSDACDCWMRAGVQVGTFNDWAPHIRDVKVKEIGTAISDELGVILASFNAG